MLLEEKTSIYFAVERSLREISSAVYAHTLICPRNCVARDAQCNTEVSS